MNFTKLLTYFILAISPLTAFSEEILGLGDIKIGSTQQEVRNLMLKQKIRPTDYFEGEDNYIGWAGDKFENVSITKNIKGLDITLFFHNDYLYLIQASGNKDDYILNELYEGFKYKYGQPMRKTETVLLENEGCGSDTNADVKQIQDSYIFNSNEKINATAFKAPNYNKITGIQCNDSRDGWTNFIVSDNQVEKIAIKLSLEYEAKEDAKYQKERFDGL
jgi:hypothetical protein